MLTIKNALAYVWRKKIKTLIIFLILLAISTLTLGSIAVKNATDAASKET
ncbi:Efflux ABC transporter, permease protein, partial [human gut metagenome]